MKIFQLHNKALRIFIYVFCITNQYLKQSKPSFLADFGGGAPGLNLNFLNAPPASEHTGTGKRILEEDCRHLSCTKTKFNWHIDVVGDGDVVVGVVSRGVVGVDVVSWVGGHHEPWLATRLAAQAALVLQDAVEQLLLAVFCRPWTRYCEKGAMLWRLTSVKDKYGGLLASKYEITIDIRVTTVNENNYSYVHIRLLIMCT